MGASTIKPKKVSRNSSVITETRKRDGNFCGVCGEFCRGEVHHIEPLYSGGIDSVENTILLCESCHEHAPDDQDNFLAYQRSGGKLAELFLKSLEKEFYSTPKHIQKNIQYVRDVIDEIKTALFNKDSASISKIATMYRNTHFGVVPLAHYVGLASSGKISIQDAREKTYAGLENQIKAIRWAERFVSDLPEIPKMRQKNTLNSELSVTEWLSEWDEALNDLWKIKDDNSATEIVFKMYRNCWLAVESFIDLLDKNTILPQPSSLDAG